MSYQALARKWRPKTFRELVGQEHVVTALTNALTRNRLHHAYLLTGTRGVGKTTIARILAKSLNCITNGITAEPCGTCAACMDIDAGRFVDLLELDAASNTGIDNMREVLDNARYMPTVGRFKVYLIDEVHMLSKAAFNSMLKTLEEPPAHVKFVLATTDPQKIPVTVLSRCLQFNLKQLSPALIVDVLTPILAAENVGFDAAALALIARAAHGSVRDALSLLDQAIAYGGGDVREDVVRTMLGAVDTEYVYRIVDALIANDGPALLAEVDAMAARSISFTSALEDLASLFHRLAVAQAVPAAAAAMEDSGRIAIARRPARTRSRAARVSDLRAGPRGSPARAGRSDRVFDDAPAPACVRACRAAAWQRPTIPGVRPLAHRRPHRGPSAAGDRRPPRLPDGTGRFRRSAIAGSRREPASARRCRRSLRERLPMPADPAAWPAFVTGLRLAPMAAQLAAQTELKSLDGNVLTWRCPRRTSISPTRSMPTSSRRRSTRRPAGSGCWRSRWARRATRRSPPRRAGNRPSRSPGPRPRFGASLSCRTSSPDLMRK